MVSKSKLEYIATMTSEMVNLLDYLNSRKENSSGDNWTILLALARYISSNDPQAIENLQSQEYSVTPADLLKKFKTVIKKEKGGTPDIVIPTNNVKVVNNN